MSVGHHFILSPSSGDVPIDVGLLGADYTVENGRYRFSKIYGVAEWSPGLSAPLAQPGNTVSAGEYLLAVGGRPLTAGENLYRRFEHTAGKLTEITVGPNSDGEGARTLSVIPSGSESALRQLDWVQTNRERVYEATNGRVGYVYLPNTAQPAHAIFKRDFFAQSDKEGIIIDARFNSGGQYADYVLDLLRRQPVGGVAMRYSQPVWTPSASITGPKVLLINEAAGSGGDMLAWAFGKYELGTIVGKRTWGGLVGITQYPLLVDGTMMTVPNIAIFDENGWVAENVGVTPDIEVAQDPAAVAAGKDPQLEKAIEVALEKLATPAPAPFAVPEPPDRTLGADRGDGSGVTVWLLAHGDARP